MCATVLVVDDDGANRGLLEEMLTVEGLRVVTAADGDSALEEFRRASPDLVLLDVQMPGMSGFEVCRQIKSQAETRLTPVVLVTGLSAVEDRVRGLEAGADDFLSKPWERNELRARVKSLLQVKSFTDELERAESVLFALARSIEGKDPYTQGHCERLAGYSARLGEKLGLGKEKIVALRRAGVVHDIGKVAVPDAILLKPGCLTPGEKKIMESHAVVGESICSPLKSFKPVLPIIRHHHEKLDGSGYPDGLRGEQIPLTARVLQVVDVFDALTTARPYKGPLSSAEALAVLETEVKRGWWDKRVFTEFRDMVSAGADRAAVA